MNKKQKLIKNFEALIEEKFQACDISQHKRLFLMLEKWAKEELNKECCDVFLQALYNAPATQDTRILLAVDKAVNQIME